ncbi:MAG: hypothetical protein D6698_08590 [Gammaproteobacteria bacterium]|nr:MAG: hypothetical protein D6698_08590 [Gammaproteobacteria bacterium]
MNRLTRFMALTGMILFSTQTWSDDLKDFSDQIDKVLVPGVKCEDQMNMLGTLGVNKPACVEFIKQTKILGESREAMKKRLEDIVNAIHEDNCDTACLDTMTKASIGLTQVIYLMDYIDFFRMD